MTQQEFVRRYLDRLGLAEAPAVDLEGLRTLQSAHLTHVPFENLDILRNVSLDLTPAGRWDKIVGRGRGGICYEMNGTFGDLLSALGFSVDLLSARGAVAQTEYDHMLLLVHLEEDYLVDVGFGDGCFVPLRLLDGVEQRDVKGVSHLERKGSDWEVYWDKGTGKGPELLFTTDLRPHEMEDFVPRCRTFETAPDSFFRRHDLCAMDAPEGHIALRGAVYSRMKDGVLTEEPLAEEEALVLRRRVFGLDVPGIF